MNKFPEKAFTKQEITKIFTEKYLNEFGAMDKRFNEQIVSKNISSDHNVYKITRQGRFVIRLYSLIADIFNINKKLISP